MNDGYTCFTPTSLHFPEESMADDRTISRLLGTLYAAPTTPVLWPEFLRDACALAGVTKAALIAHDTVTNTHRVLGSVGEGLAENNGLYEARYWEYDEWTRRGTRRLAAGRVLIGDEIWPRPELLRSVFYNEFLAQIDINSMAAVAMGRIPLEFEGLSWYRGTAEPEFGLDEIGILEMLHPHLQTALATRRRLTALEATVSDFETALNLIDSGLVLLDAAGRAVFTNVTARSLLILGQGLCLNKSRLMPQGVDAAARLRDLIAKAIATATGKVLCGGGVMNLPRAGKKPLHLLVSPLSSGSSTLPGSAVVAVFISDPERHPAVPAEVLSTLFGLTPAEARLALSILEGHSLSESAEIGKVSRETVKTQISAVFAKTGTRRQGELIRLLAGLPGFSNRRELGE